jgi:hypothetical protein
MTALVWDILENRWITRAEWNWLTSQLDPKPRRSPTEVVPTAKRVAPPGHVWDILENRWMPEAEWDELNRHIRKRICRL